MASSTKSIQVPSTLCRSATRVASCSNNIEQIILSHHLHLHGFRVIHPSLPTLSRCVFRETVPPEKKGTVLALVGGIPWRSLSFAVTMMVLTPLDRDMSNFQGCYAGHTVVIVPRYPTLLKPPLLRSPDFIAPKNVLSSAAGIAGWL